MHSSSKSRLLIQIGASLGVVLAIILSIAFLGWDLGNRAKKVSESKAEREIRIEQLNSIAELRTNKVKAEGYIEKLKKVFPDRDSLITFPSEINSRASKHNVASQFAFGNESESSIQFSLVLQGNYDNISEFVQELEEEILFLDFESIEIAGGGANYSCTLSGTIHFNTE